MAQLRSELQAAEEALAEAQAEARAVFFFGVNLLLVDGFSHDNPIKSPSVFGWSKSQRLMLDGFCPMSTRMLTSRWLPGSNLPGASGACLRGPQGPGDY